MANTDTVKSDPSSALFDALDEVRSGMLGINGSEQHMQPMTHFADQTSGKIRFITSRDTDLAEALACAHGADYTIVSKSQDFHASVKGNLAKSDNRKLLEELWSPVVGAWFDGGPEDPDAVLLELTIFEAEIWASTGSFLRFGYEIAKANMDEDAKPDVGVHVLLPFPAAG